MSRSKVAGSVNEAWGKTLRQARAKAGLTQARLALAAGVSQATIAGYETGRTSPPIERVAALAAVLGLRVIVILMQEVPDATVGLRS